MRWESAVELAADTSVSVGLFGGPGLTLDLLSSGSATTLTTSIWAYVSWRVMIYPSPISSL